MAEGGEGELLGFVFVLLGVLGGAGFDFGGEGHPEGADGVEFFGGGGAGEGEVGGLGEAVEGIAVELGECAYFLLCWIFRITACVTGPCDPNCRRRPSEKIIRTSE